VKAPPAREFVDDGRQDPFAPLRRAYLAAAMTVHLGEYMAMMVTTYLVFHRTRSVAATGLILLCYNVPALGLAGAANRLARRRDAAAVDAWLNALEGLLALVPMTLAFTHHLSVGALLGWVSAYGVCEGLNAPNSYLVRQRLAAPGRLPELNSAYTRNVAASAAVGLLLGGALYVGFGPAWVFLVCAITPVPEVIVFAQTARRSTRPAASDAADDTLRAAYRFLRTEPGLWAAGRFAVLCFFVAGYAVTLPAIADSLSTSAEVLALLESGSLLGGVLVAVVVRRVHGRVRWGHVQRLCYVTAGAGLAAIALAEALGGAHSRAAGVAALVATVPVGFAVLMNASIVTSVIQIGTPPEKRASMFTLLALIPLVVGPLSQEAIGLVCDTTSVGVALGALAVVTLSLTVLISHRPMSQHFDSLDEAIEPFGVNEMSVQRTAHRGRAPAQHWPERA
jgi:hypothetical protein